MKYSPAVVFFISIPICIFVLLTERYFGIDEFFHPDARTYIETSELIVDHIVAASAFSILNHGYYILTWLLDSNVNLLISLNIFIFSLTNFYLIKYYNKYIDHADIVSKPQISHFLFLIVVFNPYRLHISVHVLKDTIIIFLLLMVVVQAMAKKVAFAPFLLTFRIIAVGYFLIFIQRKYAYLILFTLGLMAVFLGGDLSEVLLDWNSTELSFREFDAVPTFQDFGLFGILLRAAVWPLFALSGTYAVISPAILYFPLAFGVASMQAWSLFVFRKFCITFEVFVVLSALSVVAPGFVSYNRYCLPVISVLPIVFLALRSRRYEQLQLARVGGS